MAGGLLPGRKLHEDLRGGASHVGEGLVDGGQRRARPSRGGGVVEADDAQLTGYREARHPGGLQDAECLDVAAGEDRGRPVRQSEQAERVLVAGLVGELARPGQLRVSRDAGVVEGGAVAVQPGPAEDGFRPSDDRADAAVPQLEQVRRRGYGAGPVRRADADHLWAGQVDRVDEHQRQPGPDEMGALRIGKRCGDQDQALGPGPDDTVCPGHARRADRRDADGDIDARFGRRLHDAAADLHRVGVLERVEYQADRAHGGLAAALAPADVLVRGEQLLDARPGFLRDVIAPVHHLGDGGQRHAGLARHGGQRSPPAIRTRHSHLTMFRNLDGRESNRSTTPALP